MANGQKSRTKWRFINRAVEAVESLANFVRENQRTGTLLSC